MADLIDRISGASTWEEPPRPKLNLHRFMALERLYALGEWTRAEIAAELDFQGDEATQATQLADEIDAQANLADKAIYVMRVESVCMCIEDGDDTFYHNPDGSVDKAKVNEDLQLA